MQCNIVPRQKMSVSTNLLDIPFELLPIQCVAQLSTLNKACEERAWKEFLTRDVGREVYGFLKSLAPATRAIKIEQEICLNLCWAIIRAVCPYTNTYIPCNDLMRIETCVMRYPENMEWMIHSHSTMSIIHMIPEIVRGNDTFACTLDQAIYTLSEKINDVVWKEIALYFMNEYVDVEWRTNPVSYYLVHPMQNTVYMIPSFPFYWHNTMNTRPSSLVSQITYDLSHVHAVVATLVDADVCCD